MPRYWFHIALINFLAAAALGALMRYAFVAELPLLEYRNIMHGHSHTAMLGWIYLGLYGLLVENFLSKENLSKRYYGNLFWLTQFAVAGMFIFFPIYGYKGISIFFSTLHIVFSYFFVVRFWKDLKDTKGGKWSVVFVKTALAFMVLSTLAIWCIGPVMVSNMKGSALYYGIIQFFLHFQFNGWFIFSIVALLIVFFEKHNSRVFLYLRPFYYLLLVATILTYVLAVTWSTPIPILFWINSAGVLLQLVALFYFLKWIFPLLKSNILTYAALEKKLMVFGLICFIFKILAQSVLIIPAFATIAYTIRNFVIGFLHLLLLGMVTTFLLFFALNILKTVNRKLLKAGSILLFSGIISTELLLFFQGAMFWQAKGFLPFYYELIFGLSLLMPAGILLLLFSFRTR
ncbi:MAG: hypothetical protein R2879_01220 [Saprospiraceae bacterium]